MTSATEQLQDAPLNQLARIVVNDWQRPYFGANPYLGAMLTLDSVEDTYGVDRGEDIVRYFLSNATTWRGQTARAVKRELRRRVGL